MAGELVIQEHEITCPRQYIIVTYLRSIRHRGWDSLIQCYHRWHFVLSSDINDYEPCICHFRISNLSNSWIRPLLIQLKERIIYEWENIIPRIYYCKHGTFTGDPFGADYICGACEDDFTPYDLIFPWEEQYKERTIDYSHGFHHSF